MKIYLSLLLLCVLSAHALFSSNKEINLDSNIEFLSISNQQHSNKRIDFYTWAGYKFIEDKVSFFSIWQESLLFWQSEEDRQERWLERGQDYFNANAIATYKRIFKSDIHFNTVMVKTKLYDLVYKLVYDFTTELFVLGFIWLIFSVGIILTKGDLLIFGVVLTLLISIWFGVKTYNIKMDLKIYISNNNIEPYSYFGKSLHKIEVDDMYKF